MIGYAVIYPRNNILSEDHQCCNRSEDEQLKFDASHWDQESFMKDQCQEICIHKWIESQKAGYDLGSAAVKDWINKYAKQFREYAMRSGKYFKN